MHWKFSVARLIAGSSLSLLGDQVLVTALTYVAARDTGSMAFAAVFPLISTVSLTLMGPLGGRFLDRQDRIRPLVLADLLRAAWLVGVALQLGHRALSWPLILTSMVLLSLMGAFCAPGFRALTPAVVPKAHLLQANSWHSSATRLAALSGPVLGGMLVAFGGLQGVLWLDAFSFVASAGFLLSLRVLQASPLKKASSPAAWALLQNAALRRYLLVASVINAGISLFVLMLPALALQKGLGSTTYGVLQSTYQAGMFASSIWLGVRPPQGQQGVVWGLGAMAFSVLCFSLPGFVGFSLLGALGFGMALMFTSLLADTALQQHLPREQLAQGFGVIQGATAVLRPLAIALGGVLLDHVGVKATAGLVTLLLLVTALFASSTRSLELKAPEAS